MNKNPEVDAWFEKCENPLKEEMLKVREIILAANPNMTEDIKWQAPNFMYNGNLCTFNPRAKKNVSLMFHTGAELNDEHGILEGDGKQARAGKFKDMDEIMAKEAGLISVVNDWVAKKS